METLHETLTLTFTSNHCMMHVLWNSCLQLSNTTVRCNRSVSVVYEIDLILTKGLFSTGLKFFTFTDNASKQIPQGLSAMSSDAMPNDSLIEGRAELSGFILSNISMQMQEKTSQIQQISVLVWCGKIREYLLEYALRCVTYQRFPLECWSRQKYQHHIQTSPPFGLFHLLCLPFQAARYSL